MEKGGLNQTQNKRYNYIQIPDFKTKPKSDNNIDKINQNNNNYLSQSQNNPNKNKENSLSLSIADKIKEMKEELSKDNYTNQKKDNNEFRMRLERLAQGKIGLKNNDNKLKISKKDIDLNSMKNKIKLFENQKEKEKMEKKNNFDELDNIFNNFKNNRYGN